MSIQQSATNPDSDDLAAAERLQAACAAVRRELAKVIVGQEEVIELLLIALFARGHVILEGVPGLAKTLMISSLARCLGLRFNRIQFMPDLMPADITGTEVIQEDRATGRRELRFMPGPVFANVLLADEINRTPPKTQAALLEAMQELRVTVGGQRHELEPPFFVLATQNPIEQEGTYPLPEAQQDRFMFKVFVGYPAYEEEYRIAEQTTSQEPEPLEVLLDREEILQLQRLVRRVPAAPAVIRYALDLVRSTRPGQDSPLSGTPTAEEIERLVSFGAGPRAVQFLLLGGKARAVLHGRTYVAGEDIRALAHPVLRHRVLTSYAAEADGFTPDRIVDMLLEALPGPRASEDPDVRAEDLLEA